MTYPMSYHEALAEGGRIGILGGTFDPIHKGHLALGQAALRSGKIDTLLVIPSGMPALKSVQTVSPMSHRYEMVRLAIKDEPQFILCDTEMRREGPAYMVDTLVDLAAQTGSLSSRRQTVFYLICGTDILFDLPRWHEPKRLLSLCQLLIAKRPGYDSHEIAAQASLLCQDYGAQLQFFDLDMVDLSSSHLREVLRSDDTGEQLAHLVAVGDLLPSVADLIRQTRLYQFVELQALLTHEAAVAFHRYQQALWPLMSLKRLIHSVNTALYAIHLANRHQLPCDAAMTAGVLHDVCKEMPFQTWLAQSDFATALAPYPQIIHGFMGADYVRQRFGIDDSSILDAIRYHTTSRPDSTPLDDLIYLSDKIEWGRTYSDVPAIRELADRNLKQALKLCLTCVQAALSRKHQQPHPLSSAALKAL